MKRVCKTQVAQKKAIKKNRLNSFYKMLAVFFVACCFLSCGKKFLEEKPRTVSLQDLLNSSNGGERMIAAVYNKLYDFGEHSFSWIGITSITSDDAEKGSDPGDAGTDKDQLDNWTFTPSAISFSEIWLNNFQGIGRATYALKYLPDMNIPDKERYIGEAKMLRAYFYWNLVRTFGGVPIINKVLESETDIETATNRATANEVYAYIESDLMDAISRLPMVVPATENGRVSKGAAEALLAKVYLYQKKWGQAKAMCDMVIASRQYSLIADYSLIWKEAVEFSAESIWEVNA
ncbi:MAG: RagB/SusD family nutrient uptake outer membrane protein, partial [Bacteroidota bacterium]